MAYLDELAAEHGDRLTLHVGDEGTSLRVPELIAGLDTTTELYMCGPIRLMDAVRRSWQQRGLRAPNLRFETFGNSGWFEAQQFSVHIPQLGLETVVRPGETMLEALEAAGADLMYDCRKGECGLCEVRVLELQGALDHRDVFYSERQKDATGKMCCCVSRAVAPAGGGSGRVVIEIS
jgi:ferredoxin